MYEHACCVPEADIQVQESDKEVNVFFMSSMERKKVTGRGKKWSTEGTFL